MPTSKQKFNAQRGMPTSKQKIDTQKYSPTRNSKPIPRNSIQKDMFENWELDFMFHNTQNWRSIPKSDRGQNNLSCQLKFGFTSATRQNNYEIWNPLMWNLITKSDAQGGMSTSKQIRCTKRVVNVQEENQYFSRVEWT